MDISEERIGPGLALGAVPGVAQDPLLLLAYLQLYLQLPFAQIPQEGGCSTLFGARSRDFQNVFKPEKSSLCLGLADECAAIAPSSPGETLKPPRRTDHHEEISAGRSPFLC